jgi:hypothetical protein
MQLIRRFNGLGGAFGAVCVALLVGCGDSGGGSDSMSASDSQSGTGGSEPTTGTGSEPTGSASMSDSTTGAEGGMSDSLSGTVSSGIESDSASGTTTGTSSMGTGGGESTGSSSTGEPVDCASLDNEADCVAAGCLAITGRQFVSDDADLCLDAPSFLACLEPMACDAVIEYACKGQVKYQLPSGCIPPGFMMCPAPPDQGMDGWKDCQ